MEAKSEVKIYTKKSLEKDGTKENTYKLKVQPNSKFAIQLKANPSTGFNWILANRDSLNILTPASKDGKGIYIPPEVSELIAGAPGVEQYFFTPKKTGTEMIKLEYRGVENRKKGEDMPMATYNILISVECLVIIWQFC
eukprot:TRINITY_DN17295_c0_g2_i1.p1 TRINITY_DN17295_c0_g2~~TRINITY_DN17295_c0_g2_i1.p1  ORF type:complete len:139 (-),score=39.21 TRINITY_DN17295_c0_g2_i1:155-571(-)